MSLNTCLMFYAGSLLSSEFQIGLLPWSGAAPLALLLFTFCCPLHIAMSSRSLRSSQQSLLLVPFARTSASRAVLFPWWVPRSGTGSLLNFGFSLEPCLLRFFLNLRLLFLAVLESGAPPSSS